MLGYGYGLDPTIIIVIPALLLSMWAQSSVKSTFSKYSMIQARGNVTADSVAKNLLTLYGLGNMPINHVAGSLTDHYDPTKKTLNLSDEVYGSRSIASIGVAAHEAGHAIQHAEMYSPLILRNSIVPVVNIATTASTPLFFLGLVMSNSTLVTIGIMLFTAALVFHLVTLPVEINASSRALTLLEQTHTLSPDELKGAKKVLTAAAWTYIAAAVTSALTLVRMILIANSRRRD
ncbi:MAG: zinc metallopeptidase [Synergistales bacterium]|nr:zinc metallopeptidase [Synergistales bacterium]MDY6401454.1 zinc metallopeptidase [Synergistales bacterium]MDY6404088.1 zinc metallopeptidase [Synergistales bacterium]MDY6414113.1 zinc metallopeptidase [Synergistales bacterium]MDY6422008.1 zinc metallopeptidase [Synergistales bacterium]